MQESRKKDASMSKKSERKESERGIRHGNQSGNEVAFFFFFWPTLTGCLTLFLSPFWHHASNNCSPLGQACTPPSYSLRLCLSVSLSISYSNSPLSCMRSFYDDKRKQETKRSLLPTTPSAPQQLGLLAVLFSIVYIRTEST